LSKHNECTLGARLREAGDAAEKDQDYRCDSRHPQKLEKSGARVVRIGRARRAQRVACGSGRGDCLGHREGDFPVAERIGRSIVTLPLFPAMADTDVDRVCDALRRVLAPALN